MPDLRIPGPFWSCLDCTLGSDGVSSDCEEDQVCFQTGDSYLCETSEFHGFTHTYMHSYLAKKIQWRRQPKNWHFPFDWNFPLISELVLAIWRVFLRPYFFPLDTGNKLPWCRLFSRYDVFVYSVFRNPCSTEKSIVVIFRLETTFTDYFSHWSVCRAS